MNKKALLVLTATPMLLASCNGIKKVEFKEFQEEVTEIAKEKFEVKSMKVSGKFDGDKYSFKATKENAEDLTLKEMAVLTAVSSINVAEFALLPMEDATYYVKSGFKVKTENYTVEFNKYGLPTAMKGEYEKTSVNLKVSYSFEK